ncbi:MAG: hypothetical protein ACI38Q_03670 [Candidatus Bruticola sp.]
MSSGPDNARLIIPEGVRHGGDPVRDALLVHLNRLENSLTPDGSGEVNFVSVAWHFREVIDFICIFMASASVAPLSPSEAPLPGWRRSLWRVDFAEAACGLLSWAVSYLPKRSRQNPLVEAILGFLYVVHDRVVGSETQGYAALLGIGSNTNFSQVPWSIWRERFFSRRKLNDLSAMAPGIVNYMPHLNEIVSAFDKFLSIWRLEIDERKGACSRLFLNTDSSRDELPPFIVFYKCPVCHAASPSMHVLVSPCLGKRFLYRESATGHLITIEIDPIFRRRFFTNALSRDRSSLTSITSVIEPESEVAPLVTESIEELRTKLKNILGAEVIEHYHIPLLAAVCEVGEAVPVELLRFPGFGIRDGEAAAYRLNGLVAFGEDDGVEPRSPLIPEICRDNYPQAIVLANRQLAVWAESALQTEDNFTPSTVLAVRHLADWANKSGDTELIKRLAADGSFMPAVDAWLQEMISSGSSEDRKLALEVSQKFIQFFVDSGVSSVGGRVVDLCMFCCSVYRSVLDYDKAKQELDRAYEFVSSNDRNRVVKAKVLCERARISLELELPCQAAEDAALAFEVWNKIADLGDLSALDNLAMAACLRAEAQLALGQRSQAIAMLQKVADRKANPRTPEACMAWVQLNLQLGELLAAQNVPSRQTRARFEEVLRFSKDLPETSKVIEARAKALLGLVNDRDCDKAIANLRQSQAYFEILINEQGRAEVANLHADVIYQIAFLLEKSNRLDECLQYTEKAIGIFEGFERKASTFSNRASLAKLWLLRSRIEELNNRYLEAEHYIAKSLEYYDGLISDSQVRYISDYAKVLAKRGSLRVLRGAYEEAREDLENSIEKWPGAHDLKNAKAPLARVFLNLGIAYARLNNVLSALAQFEKGLVISENRSDRATLLQVLSERVWVFFYDGQFKRAEDDFSAIFANQRNETSHKNLLGHGAACLYQGKYAEALNDFSKILSECSDDSEDILALVGAGFAYIGLKNAGRARFQFAKIVQSLANPESLPFEQCVPLVMAHFGLAKACALEEKPGEADQENKAGCDIWAKASARGFKYGNEDAVFSLFSVFYAFVPQVLFEGAVALSSSDSEAVLSPLRAVRNIGVSPIIYRLNPSLSFEAGLELVKAYTALEQGQEIISLTQELIQEASDAESDTDSASRNSEVLVAWLYLNMARFVFSHSTQVGNDYITPSYCSKKELLLCLDRGVALYDKLAKQGLSSKERSDYAEIIFFKGLFDKSESRVSSAEEAFEKAHKLYSELRSRTDNKGCELELSLVLMNLVELAESEGNEDRTVFLLDEILSVLANGVILADKGSLLREAFLKNFSSFIGRSFVNSSGVQDILGDLLVLPLWHGSDIESFESSLESRLRDRMRRNYITVFRSIIVNWSGRGTDCQIHYGEKLLSLWLEQGLMDSAAGIRDGLYLLEQLVDFGNEHLEIAHWADNFAVRAQEGLARFYASEGNNRFAVELLEKALGLIGTGADSELKTFLEVDLGIKRAELLIKSSLYEEAKEVLSSAELTLQKLKNDSSNFKEKIDHIRIDLFLRGELTPKTEAKEVKESAPAAEPEEESPLAKLVKQESRPVKNKRVGLASGFINAVSDRLLGRKNNQPKESPLDHLSAPKEVVEDTEVVASTEVAPNVTSAPEVAPVRENISLGGSQSTSSASQASQVVHIDLNRVSGVGSIGIAEEEDLDSFDNFADSDYLSSPSSFVPSNSVSVDNESDSSEENDDLSGLRRVIPDNIGVGQSSSSTGASAFTRSASAVRGRKAQHTESEPATFNRQLTESKIEAETSPTTAEQFNSANKATEASSATGVAANDSSYVSAASPQSSDKARTVETASSPQKDERFVPFSSSAKEILRKQILDKLRSGSAGRRKAASVSASSMPSVASAPDAQKQSNSVSAVDNAPAVVAEEQVETTFENAARNDAASDVPKEIGTDMERISARLNSKLARKANVSLSSAEISRNKARTAASAPLGAYRDNSEADNQGAALPASEARKISLKGTVSESQLEALTKKAAAAPPEPPPKAAPKKQITVPDSLKDRMEQARLRKERQEARQARLAAQAVSEPELRAEAEIEKTDNLVAPAPLNTEVEVSTSDNMAAEVVPPVSSLRSDTADERVDGSAALSSEKLTSVDRLPTGAAAVKAEAAPYQSGGAASISIPGSDAAQRIKAQTAPSASTPGGETARTINRASLKQALLSSRKAPQKAEAERAAAPTAAVKPSQPTKRVTAPKGAGASVSVDNLVMLASELLGVKPKVVVAARPSSKGGGLIVPKIKSTPSSTGSSLSPKQQAAISLENLEASIGKGSEGEQVVRKLADSVTMRMRQRLERRRSQAAAAVSAPAEVPAPAAPAASAPAEVPVPAVPAASAPVEVSVPAAPAVSAPVESPVPAAPAASAPAEVPVSAAPAASAPVESSVPAAASASAPVEVPVPAAASASAPVEVPVPAVASASAPAESSVSAASAVSAPVESFVPAASAVSAPVESSAPAAAAASAPVESPVPAAAAASAPAEVPVPTAPAANAPAESSVPAAAAASAPAESSAPAAASAYLTVPGLTSEFTAPPQTQGAEIYDCQSALKEVDRGFACLDMRNFDGAERCFRNVLGALNCLRDNHQIGAVMAACLEGINAVGYAMAGNNMGRRAWQVSKYACEMSRAYLSRRYDSAAWPWWGDVERQAGELSTAMQAYPEASSYFHKAVEIYLKLIDLGVGEDSRIDAINTLLKLGRVHEKMNQIEEAMRVYTDAINQGNVALSHGYYKNMTMAEAYRRLAELCMLSGYCEAAADDFAWALEFYARDSDITSDRHYMEVAAVKARLAEAYLVLGRNEEAYICRNDLMELLDYFNRYRREQDAATIVKLINNLDAAANHYSQG